MSRHSGPGDARYMHRSHLHSSPLCLLYETVSESAFATAVLVTMTIKSPKTRKEQLGVQLELNLDGSSQTPAPA